MHTQEAHRLLGDLVATPTPTKEVVTPLYITPPTEDPLLNKFATGPGLPYLYHLAFPLFTTPYNTKELNKLIGYLKGKAFQDIATEVAKTWKLGVSNRVIEHSDSLNFFHQFTGIPKEPHILKLDSLVGFCPPDSMIVEEGFQGAKIRGFIEATTEKKKLTHNHLIHQFRQLRNTSPELFAPDPYVVFIVPKSDSILETVPQDMEIEQTSFDRDEFSSFVNYIHSIYRPEAWTPTLMEVQQRAIYQHQRFNTFGKNNPLTPEMRRYRKKISIINRDLIAA